MGENIHIFVAIGVSNGGKYQFIRVHKSGIVVPFIRPSAVGCDLCAKNLPGLRFDPRKTEVHTHLDIYDACRHDLDRLLRRLSRRLTSSRVQEPRAGFNCRFGVLLGNGNGTFQTQQAFATGVGPISVTLGDVNGDCKAAPSATLPARSSPRISTATADTCVQLGRLWHERDGPDLVLRRDDDRLLRDPGDDRRERLVNVLLVQEVAGMGERLRAFHWVRDPFAG